MLWHDDTAGFERDPADEYLLQQADPARTTRADAGIDGAEYDFIGAGASADIYYFPATSTADVTLLGVSAEEVDKTKFKIGKPGQTGGYFSDETRTNNFLNGNNTVYLRYKLVGFSGPGDFSLFGRSGAKLVDWISTANGLGALDAVYAKPGTGHTDYEAVFTQLGAYDLTFRAQGYLANGTFVESADTKFRFQIGQPVPEPASLAALGLGAAALLRRRRRP